MATGAIRGELGPCVVGTGRGGIIAVVATVAGIGRIVVITVVAGSAIIGNGCVCPI